MHKTARKVAIRIKSNIKQKHAETPVLNRATKFFLLEKQHKNKGKSSTINHLYNRIPPIKSQTRRATGRGGALADGQAWQSPL